MTLLLWEGAMLAREAAISSKLGGKTLLITMNLQNIAQMSCNPAMGGVAKGKLSEKLTLGGRSALFQIYQLSNLKC